VIHKDRVDQARADMLKTIRTAIRLRHSLEADRELNEVLPRAEVRFNASIQRGILPDPVDLKKRLGL